MGRSNTRYSRGLIGILAVVLLLGIVSYFHNPSHSTAAEKPKPVELASAVAHAEPVPATAPAMIDSAPMISIGPAPTTRPARPATSQPSQNAVVRSRSAAVSATPLADGKAKMDAGDLLAARQILNDALLDGKLSDTDQHSAKQMLIQINQTIVFSPQRFADDEYGGSYSVQPGELMQKIAQRYNITWQYLCRVNGLSDPKKLRAGATIKVLKGPFYALVEKKKFNMEIWVGGEPYTAGAMYVTSFPVGLGRDDSTPTGKWMIQPGNKIKNPTYYSPRGEGVIQSGDPKNPLGQYWLGLAGVDGHAVGQMSYGIHGTIDPDSIGKQASMGCIRMKNEDVAQVFELLVEGKSTVIVKD